MLFVQPCSQTEIMGEGYVSITFNNCNYKNLVSVYPCLCLDCHEQIPITLLYSKPSDS